MKVRVVGDWPGAVTLRKGWARAESRPWNDAVPLAHLRMQRGNASFIEECVEALLEMGAPGVLSPPLPSSAQRLWREAQFLPHAELSLLRLDLDRIGAPSHLVVAGSASDIREALRIDAAAFDEFWRFDRNAMEEALSSTRNSVIHVVRKAGGGLAGFAVTGVGVTIAYLQRLAVDPAAQRRGIGRSLVRSSARWASREGARSLLLNTQLENEPAIRLYESEGFRVLSEPLAVLKAG
ncbi:MAG: GNAT family N-acetyltransferase [Actinobacteria bacterium]|nr:GNAT family N-acetyltransferase [Actinomycetota bacterium]MBU1493190.1 GNAT family N-acetyltransferase [Actinomycetota bacterium]MBU1865634.1 GNAT family N-acetyltransferase [Actinomycetota bacterium]